MLLLKDKMEIDDSVQNQNVKPNPFDDQKAKQGKVTGVIIPPPDIRAVVDKTAQFVARNGKP